MPAERPGKTIDDALRAQIKRGNFSYLSVAPSSDGKRWVVAFRDVLSPRFRQVEDADPVVAVLKALTPPRAPKKIPIEDDVV